MKCSLSFLGGQPLPSGGGRGSGGALPAALPLPAEEPGAAGGDQPAPPHQDLRLPVRGRQLVPQRLQGAPLLGRAQVLRPRGQRHAGHRGPGGDGRGRRGQLHLRGVQRGRREHDFGAGHQERGRARKGGRV